MNSVPKTLLVGLDAACWEYLDPLLKSGQLPNLDRLMQSGKSGNLDSTLPPWTPTAWASIITGKGPGTHGAFDVLWRRPGTYDFIPSNSQTRAGTPVWKYLNQHGVKVGLVNVPFTHPIEPIDGFVLTGFGAPRNGTGLGYPAEALGLVVKNLGEYQTGVDTKVLRHGSPQQVLEAERHHQAYQVEAALLLSEHYAVDVLVINLMLLDHANHKLPEISQVEEAIRLCDVDLGRLIEGFGPEQVLLLSDHGSKRVKGKFLLHAWLCDHGFQVQSPRTRRERSETFNWILVQWLRKVRGLSGVREKISRWLLRLAMPLAPNRVQEWFWGKLERSIPFARGYVVQSDRVDLQTSPLFPGSIYSGILYLNLAGREPTGVIQDSERSRFEHELKARLKELEDPQTGQHLFSDVLIINDAYPNHGSISAPDIILDAFAGDWNIQTRHYTPRVEESRKRYFVGPQGDYGWHSKVGIFVFRGPPFSTGRSESNGCVEDIAPTLLHSLDLPVPSDYEGKILEAAFEEEFMRAHPARFQDVAKVANEDPVEAYSPEEARAVTDHLRALGYLD